MTLESTLMNDRAIGLLQSDSPPEERLHWMVDFASRLQAKSLPATAVTLEILIRLTEDDISQLCVAQALHPDRVHQLAKCANQEPHAIRFVISKCIVKDCLDYSGLYALRASTLTTRDDAKQLERRFRKWYGDQSRDVPFMYHEQVYCWEPKNRTLAIPIIEDHGLACLFEGYLVTKELAFGTTVELLSAAMELGWKDWEHLWSFY